MLGYFRADPNIQSVPVCADYCDRWFEACKDDFTCYDNWEEAYNEASGMPIIVVLKIHNAANLVKCLLMVKNCATECGEPHTATPLIQITVQL